jgi:hypothetical protein
MANAMPKDWDYQHFRRSENIEDLRMLPHAAIVALIQQDEKTFYQALEDYRKEVETIGDLRENPPNGPLETLTSGIEEFREAEIERQLDEDVASFKLETPEEIKEMKALLRRK